MADKPFRFGPVALTNVLTTNILNPPVQAPAGVNVAAQNIFLKLSHIRVVNKTAGAVTVSLWVGATGANAAGTEFAWQATSVPANSFLDWFGALRMDPADFLVGGAGAATSLSIEGEGILAVA